MLLLFPSAAPIPPLSPSAEGSSEPFPQRRTPDYKLQIYHLAAILRPAWPAKCRPEQTCSLSQWQPQLSPVCRLVKLAWTTGARGDGCPSIHHLPCTVVWPENVRSDKTWEIELINSDEKNKTWYGEDCERSRGGDMWVAEVTWSAQPGGEETGVRPHCS